MRVLVISDTHSKHENLETLLKKEEPFDLAVHLGDAEGCEDKIRAMAVTKEIYSRQNKKKAS